MAAAALGLGPLIGASAALGLGNGISAGLFMALGTDMAPPGLRGPFIGVFQTIIEAGTLCGPLILGLVLQWSGDPRIGTVLCAVAGLVAAVHMALCVPETLPSRTLREQSLEQGRAARARWGGGGGTGYVPLSRESSVATAGASIRAP